MRHGVARGLEGSLGHILKRHRFSLSSWYKYPGQAGQVDHLRRTSYAVTMKRLRLPGGDLEYAVLAKLWELGTASARDIHDCIGEPAGLVYTTIAKVLDRLHEKGLVSRERRGKAFSYRAKIARDVVDRALARTALSRLFGSPPRAAVATLAEAVESIDPKLLDELERAVAARRRSRHGT
jgi:BlaI family transcriptional regulator, penicillinase repressor